jgi:hypothetical protein
MNALAVISAVFASPTLEELNRAFMSLGGCATAEGSEITAPASLRILVPRVQAVLAGRELADHDPVLLIPSKPWHGEVHTRSRDITHASTEVDVRC